MDASPDRLNEPELTTLQIGTAGEYLVAADLTMHGHRATLCDQHCPYDILLEVSGHIYRVQVKTAAAPTLRQANRGSTPAYYLQCRQRRTTGPTRYDNNVIDLVAYVGLAERLVAYEPVFLTPTCVEFRSPAEAPNTHGRDWAEYTLDRALEIKGAE